jgi:hypothetical protein
LSVWEALYAHLDESFVGRDGKLATKAIRVPDCAEEVVPEETIEDVLQAIGDGPISELREQITEMENQHVVVLEEAKASA